MTWSREELGEHWLPMVRTARGVLGSREEAEECASLALVQVLEQQPSQVRNLQAYLVTVAKRRAIDRLRALERARRRDCRLASQAHLGVADVAEDVVAQAEARWLEHEARVRLDPKVYRLLRLVADGEQVSVVAEQLGMTPRAAQSHLLRARKLLRAVWAKTLAVVGLTWAVLRRHSAGVAPLVLVSVCLLTLPFVQLHTPGQQGRPAGGGLVPVGPYSVYERPIGTTRAGPVWRAPPTASSTAKARRALARPAARPVLHVKGPLGSGARLERRHNGSPGRSPLADQVRECLQNLRVDTTHIGC